MLRHARTSSGDAPWSTPGNGEARVAGDQQPSCSMTTLLRLLINAVALWCAARFIDGISYSGSWPGLVGLALLFGIVNTFIKPVLRFFSFPVTILTLGLFLLVIN